MPRVNKKLHFSSKNVKKPVTEFTIKFYLTIIRTEAGDGVGVSDRGGGDPLGSNLFLGSQELAEHHLTIALVIIAAICLVGFTLCAVAAAVTTYRRVITKNHINLGTKSNCKTCVEEPTCGPVLGSPFLSEAVNSIVYSL